MNINGNFRNDRKFIEKIRGVPSKLPISNYQGVLEHYVRFLNVEFGWDPEHLSDEPPLEGPSIPITIDMVKKAISKLKFGKVAGPSGLLVEMIRAAGDTGATMIRDLPIAIIRDGKVPTTGSRASWSAFRRERVICSRPRQL